MDIYVVSRKLYIGSIRIRKSRFLTNTPTTFQNPYFSWHAIPEFNVDVQTRIRLLVFVVI